MEKLYPNKIVFNNDSAPYLNASNLNAMSNAIANIDQRLIDGYADAAEASVYAATAQTAATNASGSASYVTSRVAEANSAANTAMNAAGNAFSYYARTRQIAEGIEGIIFPMGTVAFANLPALASVAAGAMYNISDDFTTTSDFVEGAGVKVSAGANVYKVSSGKWDVLAGTVYTLPEATTTTLGGVKPDGTTITVDSDGTIHSEGGDLPSFTEFATGYDTLAYGKGSVAEGNSTVASGSYSHAEGNSTVASGLNSHAQNYNTISAGTNQTALGTYNIGDTTSAVIVGNGNSSARSNALTLDWSGNAVLAGDAKTKKSGSERYLLQNDVYNDTTSTTTGYSVNTITTSKTDITAGSTTLANGQLYIVYE